MISLQPTPEDLVQQVVVRGGFDAADGSIAEYVGPDEVTITADLPPANRSPRKYVWGLGSRWDVFTERAFGVALSTQFLLDRRG